MSDLPDIKIKFVDWLIATAGLSLPLCIYKGSLAAFFAIMLMAVGSWFLGLAFIPRQGDDQ